MSEEPPPQTEHKEEATPSPEGEQEEAKEEEPKKDWGAWGQLPSGFDEEIPEGEEKPSMPLLDELAVERPDADVVRETITGPDGYTYPPLTMDGIDVLKRLWAGELPPNREQSVRAWDKRVRCAAKVEGLAIPVPPKMPAKELLNRAAAVRKTETNEDMSKWTVEEEPAPELSPEMKEFEEKGLQPETVTRMLEKRDELRAEKKYQEADSIKADLIDMGVRFNHITHQWICGDVQGTWKARIPDGSEKPVELQDIDLPGSWEDFLALAEPKVLAVGPRNHQTGKRAWGAGGLNWGVTDQQQAVEQALTNCSNQGVNWPKVIWPPHLAGMGHQGKGGKGYGGKGGGFNRGYNNNNYNDGGYNQRQNYNDGGKGQKGQ